MQRTSHSRRHLSNPIFRCILNGGETDSWDDLKMKFRPEPNRDHQNKLLPTFHNAALDEITPVQAAAWNTLCDKLAAVSIKTPSKLGIFQEWAIRVSRYSFHTGSLVDVH